MAVKVNFNDLDQANALKRGLDGNLKDLESLVANISSAIADIAVLNNTVTLNTQCNELLEQLVPSLKNVVTEVQAVNDQLGNSLKSMEAFQEMANKGAIAGTKFKM